MAAPAQNIFGLTQYDGLTSFFGDQTFEYGPYILPQSAGWCIVLLFGLFFALLAMFLVWVDVKYNNVVLNSESFNTAGRSIGAGLLAVDVVSHWTWASILLQSCSYGWFYGVTGGYWYSVNDSAIVCLFAVVALELKFKAPKAHTMLEIVEIRWGPVAHAVFFCFAVLTNLLVSLSMLQGCVSVVYSLTGVNIYAMSFLIPLGVVFYACIGGLKATFTTSYFHTVIIYVVVCIFMFKVYVPGDQLNGIDDIYRRLQELAVAIPVVDNKGGSYLTGFSDGGLQFEIIFFFSALAQMLVDQSYWQSAIAAKSTSAVKGYILGSFLFLGIVFTLPVCIGVYTLALDLPVSVNEALEGLVLPAAAYVMLGKTGAVLVLVIVFMAVTSSGASEMLAISSLFTFNVYRRYQPEASGERLVLVSRIAVCAWAIIMGIAMTIAQVAGINVNWLITIIGVFVGGAVPPLACAVTWNRCTSKAAIISSVFGSACGISAWIAYAQIAYGAITVSTTGLNGPLLAGNATSFGISFFMVIGLSLIFPEPKPFDWALLNTRITTSDDTVHAKTAGKIDPSIKREDEDHEEIRKIRKPTFIIVGAIFVLSMFVWPLLTLPAGVFSLGYFRFYVVMTFMFIITASIIGIFYPIWEARDLIAALFNSLIRKGNVKNPDGDPTIRTAVKRIVGTDTGSNSYDDSAHAVPNEPDAKLEA